MTVMKLKHFFALIIGIGILIVGYQSLFTQSSRIRRTVKKCVKSLEQLSPDIECLCPDFGVLGYTRKDAIEDWNRYRTQFQKVSIRYNLYDIESRGGWAAAKIKVRATCKIEGKVYLLAGTPFGFETGNVSLRLRNGKWCIKRLDLPSLKNWIGQR